MSKWEVDLYISSHSKIKKKIEFKTEKGDYDPFYSQITILNYHNGLQIQIEAISETEEDARDAGFYFVGQALNFISYKTKLAFNLHNHWSQNQLGRNNVKKILNEEDWTEAFKKGREIQRDEPPLAMSLSWYRKSLNSGDPIDSFLSRWLVLETICKKTTLTKNIKDERKKDKDIGKDKGDIFYEIKQKLISYDIEIDWDKFYNIKNKRNDIAHGKFAINDIDTVKEIIQMNEDIKDVSHNLLTKELEKFGYI